MYFLEKEIVFKERIVQQLKKKIEQYENNKLFHQGLQEGVQTSKWQIFQLNDAFAMKSWLHSNQWQNSHPLQWSWDFMYIILALYLYHSYLAGYCLNKSAFYSHLSGLLSLFWQKKKEKKWKSVVHTSSVVSFNSLLNKKRIVCWI